jgi:uncharacterized protein YjgD (DUF1641 family)
MAMAMEELILERIERLEQQIAPLADSARSLRELRDDLAPRVNEAVHALIRELADIESDFQLEDLLFLIKRLMRNVNNLSFMLEQLKNVIDFAMTAEPLLKSTVPQIIAYLDQLEQKGLFRMFDTLLGTLSKIAETYTPEDLEQISDGMVGLLGIMKKLTAPEALAFLDKAAELPVRVDVAHAKKAGIFRLLWAMGDQELKEGLGVALELTKGLAVLKSPR